MQFRPATLDDMAALREMEQQVIAAERPFNPAIRKQQVIYYDLTALIASPDALLLVADTGAAIVATGYAKIMASEPQFAHEQHAYLGFMCVAPDHRRQGLNQDILSRLIDWSRSRDVEHCYLDVYAGNAAAIAAYAKAGFEPNLLGMRLNKNSPD